MWNKWKIFEKMTKDLNHVLFWGPKWPRNWASEADSQHTSKSTSNWYVNQDWCEISGQFMRKWSKTGIFTYFGAQGSPKIGLLGPIFITNLKVFAMSMWSNTDMKPLKTFEKIIKNQNFYLFWDPYLRPIFHTLKVIAGVYTKFSGRLSEEPFPWLIQKFPCILIFKTGQPCCQLNLSEGQIRLDLTSGRPLV